MNSHPGKPFSPAEAGGARGGHLAGSGRAVAVLAGLLCSAAAAFGSPEPPPDVPHYDLRVAIDREIHTIEGSMVVRVDAASAYPRDAWWFHLGPNRFVAPDVRGERRQLGYTTFGVSLVRHENRDPLLPDGFSPGSISISSVTDEAGRPLQYAIEANPLIPEGFDPDAALLHVRFDAASSGREVRIAFITLLPHRYWDGWSRSGIFTAQWYPQLLARVHGDWARSPFTPTPGSYSLEVQPEQPGWIAAGTAAAVRVDPGRWQPVLTDSVPLRSLALAYVEPHAANTVHENGVTVTALFPPNAPRSSLLALDVVLDLVVFMREQFGLNFPHAAVTLIAVEGPAMDMRTAGSIVLVPTSFFRGSPTYNRVFVGRLAAAVAQIWFGETVWADRDTQAWMHLGLSGLISLEYFSELYGPDAGIHDIADWLRPRYREHFFEMPVRAQMSADMDVPIMVSLHNHPNANGTRVAVYEKSPLMLRSLNLVVGRGRLRQAVRNFFVEHQYRQVDLAMFQRDAETVYGDTLDWFFNQFFYGNVRLDYALEGWEEKPNPDQGGWSVSIHLQRLEAGIMPVPIEITDNAGTIVTKHWDGKAAATTLQVILPTEVRKIVLDPDEYLLEMDRKNNYSSPQLRVRPLFDWSKQRENLITLKGWAGGDAIDGNFIGVGASVVLGEDHELSVIPAVGEKGNRILYDIHWRTNNFLVPRLALDIPRTKVGGTEAQGLGLTYGFATPDSYQLSLGVQFHWEWVLDPIKLTVFNNGSSRIVSGTSVNNVQLSQSLILGPATVHPQSWSYTLERSNADLGSDFDYTKLFASASQVFELGGDHLIDVQAIRALTDGLTPKAKQFLLGDPLVLRGYPRLPELVYEQLAALRLEYQYVVSRKIIGSVIQSRRWTLVFFGDVGKGWNNRDNPAAQPQRQDLGIGLTIDINAVGLVEFPVRTEVALPVGDSQYKKPQVILFQALSFF